MATADSFVYEQIAEKTQLFQGDIVKWSDDIRKFVKKQWALPSSRQKFKHVLVLTQTCDLTQRSQPNGSVRCAANYIALAPLIPLKTIVSEFVSDAQHLSLRNAVARESSSDKRLKFPVLGRRGKDDLIKFLSRLLNNNSEDYFYLPKVGRILLEDMVVELSCNFVIAIEAREKCLTDKVIQLAPVFQAKLGNTIGRIYSRVGTTDWESQPLKQRVKELSENVAQWIDDREYEKLRKIVADRLISDKNFALNEDTLADIIKGIPKKKEEIIAAFMEVVKPYLASSGEAAETKARTKLESQIRNDQVLAALLK